MRITHSDRAAVVDNGFKLAIAGAASAVVVMFASMSNVATAAEPVPIDIPAQDMGAALNAFGRQTGTEIAFSPEVVAGKKLVRPVRGEHEPDDALDRILSGSGLDHHRSESNVVIVSDPRVERAAATGEQPVHRAAPSVEKGDENGEGRTGTDGADDGRDIIETIVVTGSRIRGAAPDSSPLTVFDEADIEATGAATVDDFIRNIPQNFALVDSATFMNSGTSAEASTNATRGATVNLRGVGAGSTLVLLNGRRIAPAGADGAYVDVSMIPISALERVEILTDGASSLYGADAVAGVVNFIMKDDYDGAETSLRHGDSAEGGRREYLATQSLGTTWDSGGIFAAYEFVDQERVRADQRDFVNPQPGEVDVIPSQRRHSGVVTVEQDIGRHVHAFGEILYSDREFSQNSNAFGVQTASQGSARQLVANAGLGFQLFDDWNGEVVGVFSRRRTHRVNDDGPFGIQENQNGTKHIGIEGVIDGTVLSLNGRQVKAALGVACRNEDFSDDSNADEVLAFDRRVLGVFGELLIPLVESENPPGWARRLEISLSGRYDDYSDFGNSANPKVGLLWAPANSLNLRATYATSFRAPTLSQVRDDIRLYQVFPFPNPDDLVDGVSNTLIAAHAGNPALQPEEAESFTAGFDWRPDVLEAFRLSASYFSITYTDRISRPPLLGFTVFTDPAVQPFIDRMPDPDFVADVFQNNVVIDVPGTGAAGVEAFLDARFQNIARTRASGVDVSLDVLSSHAFGTFNYFVSANHLLENEFTSSPTAATVDRVGTAFFPPDFKLRAGINWSLDGWFSDVSVDYTDGYENPLPSPAEDVDSFTVVDVRLGYGTGDSPSAPLLRNLRFVVDVQNILDEDPPFLNTTSSAENLGFDATNASPLGRYISLQVSKQWR